MDVKNDNSKWANGVLGIDRKEQYRWFQEIDE